MAQPMNIQQVQQAQQMQAMQMQMQMQAMMQKGFAPGGFSGGVGAPTMQSMHGGASQGSSAAAGGGGKTYGGKGGKDFGGKGRGKGKSKGKSKAKAAPEPWNLGAQADAAAGAIDRDPRRQIEMAQRKAQQRDRSAIAQAQKSAQERFEKQHLERVQGYWIDAADPNTSYLVEAGMCSVVTDVDGGQDGRVFRNRISFIGGDLCWDARRFWHNLKLDSLPPVGDQVDRVEWTPGEGSPSKQTIVWLRSTTEPPAIFTSRNIGQNGLVDLVQEAAIEETPQADVDDGNAQAEQQPSN